MTFIKAVSMSHAGRTSNINGDSFLSGGYLPDSFSLETSNHGLHEYVYSLTSKQTTCFAVFSGLGEATSARIASQIAAEELGEEVIRMQMLPTQAVSALADRYALRLQKKLTVAAKTDATLADMSVIFAAIALRGNQAVILNIGNCKVFRYRVGQLRQFSADEDRYLGMERPVGKLTCSASELLNVRENDRFLVCSPGISAVLTESDLQKCMEIPDVYESVRQMINLAVDRGGRNSITATIIAWSENEPVKHTGGRTDLEDVGPAHDKISHTSRELNRDLKQPESKPDRPVVDKRDVWALFPTWVAYFGLALAIGLIVLLYLFISGII